MFQLSASLQQCQKQLEEHVKEAHAAELLRSQQQSEFAEVRNKVRLLYVCVCVCVCSGGGLFWLLHLTLPSWNKRPRALYQAVAQVHILAQMHVCARVCVVLAQVAVLLL